MSATFSRLKVWTKTRLKFRELNSEFDNIVNNLDVNGVGIQGLSSSTSQFQAITPTVSSTDNTTVSLPASLLEELKRLRYQFSRLFGADSSTSFWYNDPGRLLSVVPDDLVSYVPFNGVDEAEVFLDTIRHGVVINASKWKTSSLDGTSTTFSTDKKFGTFALKGGTDINVCVPASGVVKTGTISAHIKDLAVGDYVACNPLLGIQIKYIAGNNLEVTFTRRDATLENNKTISLITGGVAVTTAVYNHVLLTIRNNNDANDRIELFLNASSLGAITLAKPANFGTGGNWFFGAGIDNPRLNSSLWQWNRYSSMVVKPDAEAAANHNGGNDNDNAAAWTLVGTDNSVLNSDGLLITTLLDANNLYSKATNIDLANLTVETKVKVIASGSTSNTAGALICDVFDFSAQRRLIVQLRMDNRLFIGTNDLLINGIFIHINASEYNLIRVTSTAAFLTKVYVNGAQVYEFTNTTVETNAGAVADSIKWGVDAVRYGNAQAAFEFYAYKGDGAVHSPLISSAVAARYDDLAVINGVIDTPTLNQLHFNAASKVYGKDPKPGSFLPAPIFTSSIVTAVTGYTGLPYSEMYTISDGSDRYVYTFSGGVTFTGVGINDLLIGIDDVKVISLTPVSGSATLIATRFPKKGLEKVNLIGYDSTSVGETFTFGTFQINKGK